MFLLLTFGIAYPLLAVVLLISVTLQTTALQVGFHYHYLQTVNHPTLLKAWNKVLELETVHLNVLLSRTLNPSILLSSLFMVFFLVDLTWDNHSSQSYFILPMIFMVMVVLLMLGSVYWSKPVAGGDGSRSSSVSSSGRRSSVFESSVQLMELSSAFRTRSLRQSSTDVLAMQYPSQVISDDGSVSTVINPIASTAETDAQSQ